LIPVGIKEGLPRLALLSSFQAFPSTPSGLRTTFSHFRARRQYRFSSCCE